METATGDSGQNARLYRRLRDRQYALYDAYVKRKGLLMNTFLVLNSLFYAQDGLAQKEICERTFLSKQMVSLIVRRLREQGRVSLGEGREDRRNKVVRLTEAGRAYAEEPVRHITRAETSAMALLTQEEQEQLLALSARFTANLERLVQGEGTG